MARRRQARKLRTAESDRLYRIARVAGQAVSVFGSEDKAAATWLQRPIRALNGALPIQLLDTDVGAARSKTFSVGLNMGSWADLRRANHQCCNDQMHDERPLTVRVECYAGHRGEQTPRALILGDRRIDVAEVLDAWLAPEYRYFKLRDADGNTYLVRHDERSNTWELTMFRAERVGG